jgi:[ribosomal protein S18]-alanine N-acetyltransferase
MKGEVRSATPDDAAVLAAMHRLCFEDSWTEGSFRTLLESSTNFGYLAKSTGVESFESLILARTVADEGEILTLGTLPAARRKGLANGLLRATLQEVGLRGARRLFLEVGESNQPALGFYSRLGFHKIGTRPAYYAAKTGRAAGALILRLDLPIADTRH